MTPVSIHAILEMKCLACPAQDGQYQVAVAHDQLKEADLIIPIDKDGPNSYPTGHDFYLTERGEAYVQFLQELPVPIANWCLPVAFSIKEAEG